MHQSEHSHRRPRLLTALLIGLLFIPMTSQAPALADSWSLLEQARDQLTAASPLEAGFTQTFVPSGFSSGDVEAGALYLSLPRCMLWAYAEPFPKNFLLCGDWVYTWNPGEPSGRRYLLEKDESEGLELLRLDIDALKANYAARDSTTADGGTFIRLEPQTPGGEIAEATLELSLEDTESGSNVRLVAVEYRDQTGNRTRFELGLQRPLTQEKVFDPPTGLEWLED